MTSFNTRQRLCLLRTRIKDHRGLDPTAKAVGEYLVNRSIRFGTTECFAFPPFKKFSHAFVKTLTNAAQDSVGFFYDPAQLFAALKFGDTKGEA